MVPDFFTASEIHSDITRIDELLGCGIFASNQSQNPLFQSALTELLIRVRDLLAKSEIYAQRVTFTDDVTMKGSVTDVTGLIAFIRNAVCHIDSPNHSHDDLQARISFNVVFGKGCLLQVGETRIESPYEDDIAFFFGAQRLYLRRHIVRAYQEAAAHLKPVIRGRHGHN